MKVNPNFVAPCGLYCGVCAIYMAHRDNNRKFKERLAGLYKGNVAGKGTLPGSENLSADDIRCNGCLSDDRFMHCNQCEIRACTQEKGYKGCHGRISERRFTSLWESVETCDETEPDAQFRWTVNLQQDEAGMVTGRGNSACLPRQLAWRHL